MRLFSKELAATAMIGVPLAVSAFTSSSPHFSPGSYCGGGSTRPDCVPLPRPSRRTVEYACEGLRREALSGRYFHRLATPPREKCGLDDRCQGVSMNRKISRRSMIGRSLGISTTLAAGLSYEHRVLIAQLDDRPFRSRIRHLLPLKLRRTVPVSRIRHLVSGIRTVY